jgi:hypothetical protein
MDLIIVSPLQCLVKTASDLTQPSRAFHLAQTLASQTSQNIHKSDFLKKYLT